MWPLFSCARVCLTVHALVGPSIRPSILVVVLCACVRACVPVRARVFVCKTTICTGPVCMWGL